LRHLWATEVRKRFGLEAAKANITQVYAERNVALAATVAAEIG